MSISSGSDANFQFPNFNIPDSKKNEEWHKDVVQAITNQSLHNTYDLQYSLMNECYDFYNGEQTGDEFNFLQEAEDGDVLPAKWINYNKIKNKVDRLVGDVIDRGYDIDVYTINKDATVRKLKEKEKARVDIRVQPYIDNVNQEMNLPVQPKKNPNMPEKEEDLDHFFKYRYKEKAEMVMKPAIKFSLERCDWEYSRIALFRDIAIAGRAFVKVEMKNGIPQVRRIDPRFMIFDTNAQDDFLSDAAFFGEVRYMNIGDVAERYGLSQKQIKEVYNTHKEAQKLNVGHQQAKFSTLLGNTSLKFFKRERGELRVLVVSASWVDYKKYNHKISEDKYGNEHVKKVGDEAKGKNIKTNNIKIWRKGTLIGGEIMANWGEEENMIRDVDALHDVRSPYTCLIPNYINGHGVSKVQQLKGLQKLKDITMYNVQLAMARAGAKGFIYDVSQCPDEWDVHTVIKYLKTAGIAFIDSRKDGIPANFNQFQTFDMTLSTSVMQYLEINRMVDSEMDAISGVNEARQGIVKGASQTVGVTQSALVQSSLTTSSLYELFDMFSTHIFGKVAGAIKLSWENADVFAPIIGEAGIDFLSEDIELDLNDYGVFIRSVPKVVSDINMMHQLVQAALSSGQINFISALKLLRERDVDAGIREFEKALEEAEQKAQEQQMMMQQQQAEMAMQQQQAQAQSQQQIEAQKLQAQQQSMAFDVQKETQLQGGQLSGDLEKIREKGEVDMKLLLAKLRGDALMSKNRNQ